jgi:hypothetical protein
LCQACQRRVFRTGRSWRAVAAVGGEAAAVFSGNVDDAQGQGKWLIFLFHSLAPTDAKYYATSTSGAVTGSYYEVSLDAGSLSWSP